MVLETSSPTDVGFSTYGIRFPDLIDGGFHLQGGLRECGSMAKREPQGDMSIVVPYGAESLDSVVR
jgi:hypothetical protein